MADKKISALTAATTPLAGTEVLPIVQGGSTVKVAVSNLTAGRTVSASTLDVSTSVGIGTAAPQEALHIAKAGATNAYVLVSNVNAATYFGTISSGATQIYNNSANPIQMFTSAVERLRVTSDGDITANTGNLVIGTAGKGITTSGATALGLGVDNAVDAITIDTSKNIGIGTASPGAKLQIQEITGTTGFEAGFSLTNAVDSNLFIQITGSGNADKRANISTSTPTSISFATNSVERGRFDAAGNFLVNTGAISATATDGFLYIPTCAGTPTGTPTTKTGLAPLVVDSINNKLYVYVGGAWQAMN